MQPHEENFFELRGRVFDGERLLPDGIVQVRSGRIELVREAVAGDSARETVPGGLLVPGFVDIHVHGAVGADFADGDATSPGRIARHLLSRGTTSFVATLVSSSWPVVQASLGALAAFRQSDPLGSAMLGVHFEGPFLSPSKRGAHAEENLMPASLATADAYLEAAPAGLLRAFTLAPELDGGPELIRHLLGAGALVALGHSRATYEQTQAAIALGARHATHLFNAMAPLHHREPGIVGAFLDSSETTVEVIPDGVHLHPALLRLIARQKGAAGVAAVSDAVPAAGLPSGGYAWQGRPLTVRAGGAYLPDGTLAGSVIDMPGAARILTSAGIPLESALRMATETPARIAGVLPHRGRLAAGARADIVALGPELTVEQVWLEGRPLAAMLGPGIQQPIGRGPP